MDGYGFVREIWKKHSNQRGFTLIELIVTLSVAGILMAIAVPAFREMILGSQLRTLANETAGTINFVRSEAIKRGGRVTLCPSADGASCANNGQWEQGWLVFDDPNENGTVDGGETIIRVRGALGGQTTMRTGAHYDEFLSYTSSGRSIGNGGSNDTFRLCNQRGADLGFAITVNTVGRVRVVRGVTGCP